MSSKDDSDDDADYISYVDTPYSQMPINEVPAAKNNDDLNEVSDILSAETDEESEGRGKSFLKYKHKSKKAFRMPKNLYRLTEHLAKVENVLMGKRKSKSYIRIKSLKKSPATITHKSDESLTPTPSEVVVAPSDFEHMFHNKVQIDPQLAKAQSEKEEKQKNEKEVMFQIFKRSTNQIPIFTLDQNQAPKMLEISLSRLNLLNQMYKESLKSSKTTAIKKVPTLAAVTKVKTNPKNQNKINPLVMDKEHEKEMARMNLLKIKNMIKPFIKPNKSPSGSSGSSGSSRRTSPSSPKTSKSKSNSIKIKKK